MGENRPGASVADLSRQVFIVDDHPIVRQALKQVIDQEPDLTVCGEAGDVASALEGVSSSRPAVVLVDLSLKESSGLRLIEELKSRWPDLAILVLTMHSESRYAERCLAAGARGYITKQERPEEVVSALRQVLAGGLYVSDSLRDQILVRLVSGRLESDASPIERLSSRELEVFNLLGTGLKTREIAAKLNLSTKTVETHIGNMKRKLHLESSRELLILAARWSMGEPGA
jgi:DNA-binding NarL/FixJ family response regulator